MISEVKKIGANLKFHIRHMGRIIIRSYSVIVYTIRFILENEMKYNLKNSLKEQLTFTAINGHFLGKLLMRKISLNITLRKLFR